MAKNRVLVDTSVLISIFRGNKEAKEELENIGIGNIVISQITAIELFAGCNTIQKRDELSMQLKKYHKAIVDHELIEKTIVLVKRYAINNKIFAADAIIAMNALIANLELFTYNKKDFEFIKDLKLYPASK